MNIQKIKIESSKKKGSIFYVFQLNLAIIDDTIAIEIEE